MRALYLLSSNAADLSSLNKRRVRATNIAWPAALTTLAAPEKRTEPPFVVHWPTIYRHFEASCGPDVQRFAVPGPYALEVSLAFCGFSISGCFFFVLFLSQDCCSVAFSFVIVSC